MRLGITITMSMLLSAALGISNAAAQVAPVAPCQTCQSCPSPYGCNGHAQGCCCEACCRQAPPNPLAPGRPSPPPCCADGYAYPNYMTWGHYATRWRRWPIELAAATPPGAQAPRALSPDVKPYETPMPDEEDRRAPPPSAPRGKPLQITPQVEKEGDQEATPAAPARPREGTATPQEDTGAAPLSPESIFGIPVEETPPSATPPFGAPTEATPQNTPLMPESGSESSPTTVPLGEPMGELDLPPALPFAVPAHSKQPAVRAAGRPSLPAPKREVRTAPQDDPPPALPIALASVSR